MASDMREHLVNDPIGPRYDLKVGRLREWHVVKVTCGRCRRVAGVSGGYFLSRFPPHMRLRDLEHRLRCTECQNRYDNEWQVCRIKRD